MPDKQETPALDCLLELAKVLSSSDHLASLVLHILVKSFTMEKGGRGVNGTQQK